jgi:phospholipid transport system substrate-binding protein
MMIAAALAAALSPAAVYAQAADPGAAQIEAFNAALLATMKQGKSLGVNGRYQKLAPAVDAAFDLPTMTRFAVGPKWLSVAPADQAALVKAFSRMTVASYAKNFDDYSGERFAVDANVQTRGPDKLVKSHIIPKADKPTDLIFRMRQASDGKWKVIDVYYQGSISELTTRRSDFAATLASGGAPALLKKIDALADKLMAGG